jgi:uncharacterized protein YbjQ (UPF0145 family)
MELLTILTLLGLGYFFGKSIEAKHFKDLARREKATEGFPIHSGKKLPSRAARCFVVSRAVVISDDHFKRFSASVKSLFGGRLTAYETLLDRARREATLRLKESAAAEGAEGVVHFRLETCNLFSEGQKGGMGAVQVTAYGTAYS